MDDIIDMLPYYYSRIFPLRLMHQWLSYGNDDNVFANREFSFVLPGDLYIRYQSFANADEFARQLHVRTPEKIDIGAVFNLKPKTSKGLPEFQPVQKEFVLDIDLTDYDEIRTCCSGASVCAKCWKFMVVAVEILDAALREDFGFVHLLWVFSGRRGIHCWVCDEVARFLDSSGRSAIIEYLSVVRGGENQAKKVKLPHPIHPSIQRALTITANYFDTICLEEQGIFEKDQMKNFSFLDPDLKSKVLQVEGTRKRWNELVNWVRIKNADKSIKTWKQPKLLEEIQLQFCYPRLDVNVSKGLNHLLKAPFCVHPKTGRICVPFDPKKIQEFNISEVPTIEKVIDEINQFGAANPDAGKMPDWKKTSVAPFMEVFKRFVEELDRSNAAKVKTDVSMDF